MYQADAEPEYQETLESVEFHKDLMIVDPIYARVDRMETFTPRHPSGRARAKGEIQAKPKSVPGAAANSGGPMP